MSGVAMLRRSSGEGVIDTVEKEAAGRLVLA